jgi:F0F1-type ATP synthase alpha subunit
LLDDVPVDAVRDFETFFFGWLERKAPQMLGEIRDKKELSDTQRDALAQAVLEAKTEFMAAKGIKAA